MLSPVGGIASGKTMCASDSMLSDLAQKLSTGAAIGPMTSAALRAISAVLQSSSRFAELMIMGPVLGLPVIIIKGGLW